MAIVLFGLSINNIFFLSLEFTGKNGKSLIPFVRILYNHKNASVSDLRG